MRRTEARGITLLEVVAGVALLSLLAVAVTTTLRMATAQLGAEDRAAEVDRLSSIARTAATMAQDQVDTDEADLTQQAETASQLATQALEATRAEDGNASCRIIEIEYAGHRYSWLILEGEQFGVSAYLGREEGR